MPTFIHGKDSKVYVDEFDMSSYFNNVSTTQTNETGETTTYADTNKAYIVGLASSTLTLAGLWSQDTDGSDEELQALLGSATSPIVTVAEKAGTIGNRAILAKADELTYAVTTPVADVANITADFQCNTGGTSNLTYAMSAGVQLLIGASSSYLDFPMTLASVDNAASSANGGFGILHVPTNTLAGGTTTFKIQHSANDSTWADLISFTAVAASTATSQLSAVSGTVNRYLRAIGTTAGSSGSITSMASFARF